MRIGESLAEVSEMFGHLLFLLVSWLVEPEERNTVTESKTLLTLAEKGNEPASRALFAYLRRCGQPFGTQRAKDSSFASCGFYLSFAQVLVTVQHSL